MDQFVVSARKYRPTTFDSVVGQHSITSTLKNALKSNHLAQAFLFCGPRGVGKTTCARILAKTINCTNLGKEIEPCNKCDSCTSFNGNQSLNILELDAASNNSVDDIRNLADQVRFAPQMGTHKVYIIDEVHMLSQAAFNAFLKTLEEPPAHAIFILATTEKHKIIPTILSRCQIFDFKRIQIEDISNHLGSIAQKENIKAESDGLHIIAQKADGALRDALSIFDQIVSFSGKTVSYKDVITNLNILDYDYYFRITDHILSSDIPSSLVLFNSILNKGFNGHNLIVGLAEHFRNLLVCKDQNTIELLEVGEKIKEQYLQQSNLCDQSLLLTALNVCNKCDINYKASKNQRLHVELALMQLCSIKSSLEKKTLDVTEIDITLDFSGGRSIKNFQKQTPPQHKYPADYKEITSTIKEPQPKPLATQQKTKLAPKTLNKSLLGNVGVSLKNNLAKTTEEVDKENFEHTAAGPTTPFEFKDLHPHWKAYAKKIRAEGKESFYTTLVKHEPTLLADYVVQITIENKVQQSDINSEAPDLQGYLRKKLNNSAIKITSKIILPKQENVIYTSRDKFKRMAEKNPDILKLKDHFDLDIEY